MKLVTQVNIEKASFDLTTTSKVLTVGSCFSDHIGIKLDVHSFPVLVNPFGTTFNPISVFKSLDRILDKTKIDVHDIEEYNGRCFHYDFHSSFDGQNRNEVAIQINSVIESSYQYIEKIDLLIITFGTSIAYRRRDTEELVSNCHKVPGKYFEKVSLKVEEMMASGVHTVDKWTSEYPNSNIILTVSPVRHTKEGLIENSFSKSKLLDLCYKLTSKYHQVNYFPSYEIMIDELRDYRYYKSDLIHPTPLAVDIIWNKFVEYCMDFQSLEKLKDISDLNRAINHKPFDAFSDGYIRFKKDQFKKLEILKKKYPELDFQKYISILNQ